MIHAVVLFITLANHFGIPPIQLEVFNTERECHLAAEAIGNDQAALNSVAEAVGLTGSASVTFSCRVNT